MRERRERPKQVCKEKSQVRVNIQIPGRSIQVEEEAEHFVMCIYCQIKYSRCIEVQEEKSFFLFSKMRARMKSFNHKLLSNTRYLNDCLLMIVFFLLVVLSI